MTQEQNVPTTLVALPVPAEVAQAAAAIDWSKIDWTKVIAVVRALAELFKGTPGS